MPKKKIESKTKKSLKRLYTGDTDEEIFPPK
jgi:hypothetical protein